MKKYLRNFLVIGALFIAFFALYVGAYYYCRTHMDWRLPSQVHVLMMGASLPQYGFNDSLTEETVNVSRASERYLFTYLKLQNYVAQNSQIDTVFLQCSAVDLWQHSDFKYHSENDMSWYLPIYWPLFSAEEWNVFKSQIGRFIPFLVQKSWIGFTSYRNDSHLGGFEKNRGEFDPSTFKVIPALDNLDEIGGEFGNKVQYQYLRKIIDFCSENNIKLYLLDFPGHARILDETYNYEYIYAMRDTYFNDVEFVDYSHWPVANNELRDWVHLNYHGAERFTKELCRRFNLK